MIFSVITVVKNNLHGLQKTYDSVILQTCPDWEWVVIDGASVDGTGAWLASLNDARLRWISEPDCGIYSAMNKGIESSSGQHFIFLNSGDFLADKHVLQHLADFIDRSNLKPMLIYGDTLEQDKSERIFHKRARSHSAVELGMFASHQSMVFAKDIFTELRYGEHWKLSSDYALVCEVLRRTDPSLISRVDYSISRFSLGGTAFARRWLGLREDFTIRRNILRLSFFKNSTLFFLQLVWHLFKLVIPWNVSLGLRKITMK
jgi:putative colanic acid biosynthesis glycosyltransferase